MRAFDIWRFALAGLLAAAVSASPAAARQPQSLYVVGCSGQVDEVSAATGATIRSRDLSQLLSITRNNTASGATFDGCLMNQAVFVPADDAFYSVVPVQYSLKSDATKDYRIARVAIATLRPVLLPTIMPDLENEPRIAAAATGVRVVADQPVLAATLGSEPFTPQLPADAIVLEASGTVALIKVAVTGSAGLRLAVADLKQRRWTLLAPNLVEGNVHLAPGGAAMLVQRAGSDTLVLMPATGTARSRNLGRRRIDRKTFIAISPAGFALYRTGGRYLAIALGRSFPSTPVVSSDSEATAHFFAPGSSPRRVARLP